MSGSGRPSARIVRGDDILTLAQVQRQVPVP